MKSDKAIFYANEFASNDGKLKVHFIGNPTFEGKSDGFLLQYGKELYLIDAGEPQTEDTLAYLLALRADLLREHPEYLEDENCKLRLHWLISHFHTDHVGVGIRQLMPNPYLSFGDLWLPPDATVHPDYTCPNFDGDESNRPRFAKALEALSDLSYTIHDIAFGAEHKTSFSTDTGCAHEMTVTIFPPTRDYGEEQYMQYYTEHYSRGEKNRQSNPLSAVNNSSNWFLIRLGSRSFLFTGDTMKRSAKLSDEGLDHMLEAYGDEIGKVDVIKFPHHGFVRENAIPGMLSLDPQYMIVTYPQSNIAALLAEKFPDATAKVLNAGQQTVVFTCGFDSESGEELPLTYEIFQN